MEQQKNNIKVYYGLKWVEFNKHKRRYDNRRYFLYVHPMQPFSIKKCN